MACFNLVSSVFSSGYFGFHLLFSRHKLPLLFSSVSFLNPGCHNTKSRETPLFSHLPEPECRSQMIRPFFVSLGSPSQVGFSQYPLSPLTEDSNHTHIRLFAISMCIPHSLLHFLSFLISMLQSGYFLLFSSSLILAGAVSYCCLPLLRSKFQLWCFLVLEFQFDFFHK